uniref:Glucuronosyltransferase n=1 Tax=Heliothis virescens TaxID=7102 RepID=A0A2A4IT53_HELVI
MKWHTSMLVFCALAQLCACARVLVMFPVASRSHTLLGDHLVKTLLKGGHNVTYITTFTRVKAAERLAVVDISSVTEHDTEEIHVPRVSELPRLPSPAVLREGARAAERALRHPRVQALLSEPARQYDLVLAEWFYSGLLAPLAAVFECPLVWYSAVDACWMNVQLVHEPTSPTYFVDLLAPSLPAMPPSVADRLYRIARQAYLSAWVYYMTQYVESPAYYEIYQLAIQQRGRTPPLYEEAVRSGAMLLVNSQPLLGQAVPLPHSAKYVGGHHVEGADVTLPKKLQDLLDNAKHGVIYVNLGGSVSEELPLEMKQELLRAFRQLEQTVVWRHRGHLDHVPGNVHLMERLPHLAILSHPKTVMLISHGGFLSYMEAMYHGVPLVGLPLKEDHFLIMDLVVSRGRGLRVPLSNMIGYRVKEAIIEILGNYSYRGNAKEVSDILQNPLVPVNQELLYWVELVVRSGGAPHLRSPALQLTLAELYHLDVAAVLVMIAWFLTKVAKLLKVYWDDYGTDCDDVTDKKNE